MNLAKSISSIAVVLGRAALVAGWMSIAVLAQSPPTPSVDPAELMRRAVQNEIKESNSPSARFMFRGTKTTPTGSATKLYVETSEATAGMAVAYDGRALTEEQRQREMQRLGGLSRNPEELRKKRAQEHDDTERTMRIVRAMPDAFLYEYAGEMPGSVGVGHVGDPLVKLKFRPNPNYRPPSRVEEVLTGMQGDVLIDAVHYRIASIDGTLFKEVGFGWGILGHLNRGGHFLVHQQAVEDNLWEISCMSLKFTGRILLVKALSIDSTEVFSDFQRVSPNLTFAQAVELLKTRESSMAQNRGAVSGGRK